jgi:prepilin-type N-terminal cleavage/methylation domain-containing protein
MGTLNAYRRRSGFTIVELIVVIVVIAILAAIVIFSVGAWQDSIRRTAVKNDLNAVSASMESARNFATSYPLSIPSSFSPSENVSITLTLGTATQYCIDGVATQNTALTYYVYSKTKDKGPQEGSCATRPDLEPPVAPASVSIASTTGTSVNISWASVADAVSYIAQCASDPAYIYGPQQTTVTQVSGTVNAMVTGLTPSTTFYCRVKAVNSKGTSVWSGTNSQSTATTDATYGSLAVGTSIEGYWTTPPQGFLLENGAAISRATYSDLFAVIGTTYGPGDGATTFNVPDSRGRTSVNRKTTDAEFATIGQVTGSKTEQLTIAQMPSHNHAQYTGTKDDNNWSGWSFWASPQYPAGDGPNTYAGGYTSNTGSGAGHNNIQPSIVKTFAIKYAPIDTAAPDLPAGTSIGGYWASVPSGYVQENGAAISRTTYADLFNAIGTTYGAGNGSTTFNVPDSQGRAGVNISPSDTEFDVMGEMPGSKTETLTIAQIPSHNHLMYIGQPDDLNFTGGATQVPPGDGPGADTTSGLTFSNTGGGGSHNNIQPSITKMFAIKTTNSSVDPDAVATGTSISGYWSSATPPPGYLEENGAAVSRSTYATLFRLVGTTFGAGDGSTTFNLPDSRGRLSVNLSPADPEFNTIGEKYGAKIQILTIAQLPAHNHQQTYGGVDDRNFSNGQGQYPPGDGPGAYNQGHVTAPNGGGGSHNEIQPSIVKRSFIKY